MGIKDLVQPLTAFYSQHSQLTIVVGVALLVAAVVKPKQIFKILGALAVLMLMAYIFMSLGDTVSEGIDSANDAGQRTGKAFRDSNL